jgi:predicted enzyme related to lactoylglutathione lyase
MSYLHGKFVWFEHLSADPESAARFHAQLFGWGTQSMAMGEHSYTMITNGGEPIGGYGAASTGEASWRSYLSVADVDSACAAAQAAGATLLMPPTNYGNVGRAAVIRDVAGAVVALWKAADGDPADATTPVPGRFCWNELYADDPAAAARFYERVVGYSGHDEMDMGPQGTYYILKTGDVGRAGVMRRPMPEQPAIWVPYVTVADADAAAERAKGLGATVCVPPMDIPNVGRFTMLVDPAGAMVSAIKLMAPA